MVTQQEMAEFMDEIFGAKVGDMVAFRGTVQVILGRDGVVSVMGCKGVVVERVLKQCHGGIQTFLYVQFFGHDGQPSELRLLPTHAVERTATFAEDIAVAKAEAESLAAIDDWPEDSEVEG